MANINAHSEINGRVIFDLTEGEARALDAIVGYGADPFVKWFYKNCGQHYLKPHEKDMRSLFDKLRQELPKHLSRFDKARKAFNDLK